MHDFMRTILRWRALLGVFFCALGVIGLAASPSQAETKLTAGFRGIDVVQIDGLIDPPNATLMLDSIRDAERRGSTALILQIDSEGTVATNPWNLAQAVREAKVPIAVWIGPAGAQARGGAALIAAAAPVLYMASNATIGPLEPLRLDGETVPQDVRAAALPIGAERTVPVMKIASREISAKQAVGFKLADAIKPVVGEAFVGLDGKTFRTRGGPIKLSTAQVRRVGKTDHLEANQPVRFRKLTQTGQFQHTLGAPWAALFLFAIGGSLILFEFFTISIGIAGVVGALCLVFASFGFSHLPVQWWAVALLTVAFFGFGVDIQAGGLGPWTILATIALVAGSLTLYGGSSDLDPAWWITALICAGVVLFMLGGMTAMLRSRFSTPTVGREGMIGEMGDAETDISPDGLLALRGTVWKARTNRATPVKMGERARVTSVDGLVLEVEPEAGGAKDYRDRGH